MSDSRQPTNRLSDESSPYLRLHQHNPVDWYPWSHEALTRAVREDKPIFLSVGYSTCYWCHVMERESFTDPSIAELMNRSFVNIKVDREERPELDEIYMTATQILTHQGGWPNSVFLTPQLKPFFAGTYFPPRDRAGRPGFASVLSSIASAWMERREEIEEQSENVALALRRLFQETPVSTGDEPAADLATACLEDLSRRFDASWGGFGGAPKFPTPSNLILLLELADLTEDAAEMLTRTLDAMARGGIYDQLGGGFHRYATDRQWRVPHFEKMLYDNGWLLEIYAREWSRTHDPETARVVRETARFILGELTGSEGAFWSAIDAETEGREGSYYVWTSEQLRETLGEQDFRFLAPLLGFAGPPFFEGRSYVLYLPEAMSRQAERRRMRLDKLWEELAPLRQRLLNRRQQRRRPATDDKVLVDWNGMAISGLCEAGRRLGDRSWVHAAAEAAEFLLSALRPDDRLHHSWRQGRLGADAFLSDYVFMIRGLLSLYRATDDVRWLSWAQRLAVEQRRRLGDRRGGYFVAADSADVLVRSKEVVDGAVPGANAIAILNLLELADLTGEEQWLAEAESGLRAFESSARSHPAAVKTLAVADHRLRAIRGLRPSSSPAEGRAISPHLERLAVEARRVVRAELDLAPPDADGRRTFSLRVEIDPGWHLYAPGQELESSQSVAVTGDGLEARAVEYPAGSPMTPSAGGSVRVYRDAVEIRGSLRGPTPARSVLRLKFQACDHDRCLPPTEIVLPVDERDPR